MSIPSSSLTAEVPPLNRVSQPAPTLVWKPESIIQRPRLAEVLPQEQPFEVEVGCGDGSFLIRYAQAHPERNFLGIERLLGRTRKTDRKGLRAGLRNLRVLRLEAAYSVEFMLPAAAAAAVHVYFPDPWPKRRHHGRRLINPAFVATVCRALAPGGRFYLRTDDLDYFKHMGEVCGACPLLKRAETPPDLAAVITDFERGFLARGVATNRLAFERLPD